MDPPGGAIWGSHQNETYTESSFLIPKIVPLPNEEQVYVSRERNRGHNSESNHPRTLAVQRHAGFSRIVVPCQLRSVTFGMLRLDISDHDRA